MSRVSVIIPVYNVEKYLPECLDSVLGQTLRDLEVIAVDDCSPDRCGEILDAYASKDSRVKVIHLPQNHMQGYGRNRGLERASGTYCYFLDSDDTIVPEALEELADLADREELDAVFFDSENRYEREDLKKLFAPPMTLRKGTYPEEAVSGAELLDLFMRQGEWTCYPQRTFWRRDFLLREEIRYPEGVEHEDEYFAFAGILAAGRARYVRKPYFRLRVRDDSVMTSRFMPKNFHGYLLNYYLMNRFAAQRGLDTFGVRSNIYRMYDRAMTLYLANNAKFDLSEPFVSERDRIVWSVFRNYIRGEFGTNNVPPAVYEKIRRYRTVYIFGAGVTAQRFCNRLEHKGGVVIAGFLVSDASKNPEILLGRPVYQLDRTDVPSDAIVVGAVQLQFWDEIREELEKRKIACTFHRW